MKETIALSDAEWQVMKSLWSAPESVTAASLADHFRETTGWHLKTVRTMLARLEKKGAVDKETREGVYHYFPRVDQSECYATAAESFIDKVFDGALTPMVAHFTKRRSLSPEDRKALEELLKSQPDDGGEK